MRLRSIVSAFAVGVALVATSAQTVLADPPPNTEPPEVTVTAEDASGAAASCIAYASQPNHSGSRMTGTGGIRSCSGGPVACTSEADLEFYNNFSNMWMTAATSRQFKCAPPLRSSTAAATCVNHPGDPKVGWRTTTVAAIVSSSGSTGHGTANSPVLYVPCA